jgi:hypothetical protein
MEHCRSLSKQLLFAYAGQRIHIFGFKFTEKPDILYAFGRYDRSIWNTVFAKTRHRQALYLFLMCERRHLTPVRSELNNVDAVYAALSGFRSQSLWLFAIFVWMILPK